MSSSSTGQVSGPFDSPQVHAAHVRRGLWLWGLPHELGLDAEDRLLAEASTSRVEALTP